MKKIVKQILTFVTLLLMPLLIGKAIEWSCSIDNSTHTSTLYCIAISGASMAVFYLIDCLIGKEESEVPK